MKLLGSWPSLTNRGPSYILHFCFHFRHQIDVIIEHGLIWDGERIPDDEDVSYILFRKNRDMLGRINWNSPLESSQAGLVRMDVVHFMSLSFNARMISDYQVIVDRCKNLHIPQP